MIFPPEILLLWLSKDKCVLKGSQLPFCTSCFSQSELLAGMQLINSAATSMQADSSLPLTWMEVREMSWLTRTILCLYHSLPSRKILLSCWASEKGSSSCSDTLPPTAISIHQWLHTTLTRWLQNWRRWWKKLMHNVQAWLEKRFAC